MNWRSRPTVIAASSTSRARQIQSALAQGRTARAIGLLRDWLEQQYRRAPRRRPVAALESCVALLLHPSVDARSVGLDPRRQGTLLRMLGLPQDDQARVLAAVAESLLVLFGPAAAWPWLSRALATPGLGDGLRSLLLLSYAVHEWTAGRPDVAESTYATIARWERAMPFARHQARLSLIGLKVARGAPLSDPERALLFSPEPLASAAQQAPTHFARAQYLFNSALADAARVDDPAAREAIVTQLQTELDAAEQRAAGSRLDIIVEARLLRVQLLLETGRFRSALDALDTVAPLIPPDAAALQAQLARARGMALLTTIGRGAPDELPESFAPPAEALTLLEHAEQLFDQAGRAHEVLATQVSLLIAHARAGHEETALQRARQLQQDAGGEADAVVLRAAALAVASGRPSCALALVALLPASLHSDAVLVEAGALEQLGRQQEALQLMERSAAAPEASDYLRLEARLWSLARRLAAGEIPSEADRVFLFSEATLQQAGAQRVHGLRGRWWLFVGAAESAAQSFERAMEAVDPVLSPVLFVGAAELWLLARTLCGDTDGLEEVVYRLLAAGRELPPLPRASLRLRVGNILAAAGQPDAALQQWESIVDELRSLEPPPPQLALAELSVIELRCGRSPAESPPPLFWEERLARFPVDTHPAQHALLRAARGRVTRSDDDLITAAELLTASGNHQQALPLYDEAAALVMASGRAPLARQLQRRGSALVPELLRHAASDASRVGILARFGDLLMRHLELVLEETPDDALELVQLLRLGAMERLRGMAGRRTPVLAASVASSTTTRSATTPSETTSDPAPSTTASPSPSPAPAQIWEQLTHERPDTGDVHREAAATHHPHRPPPSLPSLGATARALAPLLASSHRRCVEIQLLGHRVVFLIVHPDARVEARSIAWDASARELLEEVRHRLRSPVLSRRELRVLQLGLRRLHALLVDPWLDTVPAGAQLLLSHGASLAQLPWAALLDANDRPLLERHPLAFATSAAEWPRLIASAPMPVRSAVVLRGDDALAGLPPLLHADDEVRGSIALLRRRSLEVAAPDAVDPLLSLATAQLVHYAGHARFDAAHGMGSAIYPPSGALSAVGLLGLGLPPQQVWVLSGCETTRPDERRGEESVGLLRPLLASGAAAVLGSLWPVDDATTSNLVLRILERWLNGTPLTDSWREASLALLHAGAYHPAIWANLVPYGWAAGAVTPHDISRHE